MARADLIARLFKRYEIACDQSQRAPLRRKPLGNGQANPLGSARDHGDLAFQVVIHCSPSPGIG